MDFNSWNFPKSYMLALNSHIRQWLARSRAACQWCHQIPISVSSTFNFSCHTFARYHHHLLTRRRRCQRRLNKFQVSILLCFSFKSLLLTSNTNSTTTSTPSPLPCCHAATSPHGCVRQQHGRHHHLSISRVTSTRPNSHIDTSSHQHSSRRSTVQQGSSSSSSGKDSRRDTSRVLGMFFLLYDHFYYTNDDLRLIHLWTEGCNGWINEGSRRDSGMFFLVIFPPYTNIYLNRIHLRIETSGLDMQMRVEPQVSFFIWLFLLY